MDPFIGSMFIYHVPGTVPGTGCKYWAQRELPFLLGGIGSRNTRGAGEQASCLEGAGLGKPGKAQWLSGSEQWAAEPGVRACLLPELGFGAPRGPPPPATLAPSNVGR